MIKKIEIVVDDNDYDYDIVRDKINVMYKNLHIGYIYIYEDYYYMHIVGYDIDYNKIFINRVLKNIKNENEMYMNYGYSLLKAREEIIKEFKNKIRGV